MTIEFGFDQTAPQQSTPAWTPIANIPIIYQAITYLNDRCDGANTNDNQGFSGFDARFGNDMARIIARNYTPTVPQIEGMYSLVKRYRNTQLAHFVPYWDKMLSDSDHLKTTSHAYFHERERQRNADNACTDNEIINLFMRIQLEDGSKDEDFITSLQAQWQIKDWFSEKQMAWVRTFVLRYEGRIDPTGRTFVEPLNIGITDLTTPNPRRSTETVATPVSEPPIVTEPTQQTEIIPVPANAFEFGFAASPLDDLAALERSVVHEVTAVDNVISFQRGGETIELVLDDTQRIAVAGVMTQQFSGITGAAGTGKTTVTRVVVEELEKSYNPRPVDIANYGRLSSNNDEMKSAKHVPGIAFAAYTGKAMQQMKKALPELYHDRCFTIHKLLGFHPVFEERIDDEGEFKTVRIFAPLYTETFKMPWSVLVLDEASMIPGALWEQLLTACKDDIRIIMIGDINQLPPIHGRSVMGFAMLKWPFYELTHIHRQKGEHNPIVDNAWAVLKGEFPQPTKDRFDMIRVSKMKSEALQTLHQVIKALHTQGQFDPTGTDERAGDMIIVGQNVDVLGQRSINEMIVPFFNPPPTSGEITQRGRRVMIISGYDKRLWSVGDKVMTTVNDHDANITNGMSGHIVEITANGRYHDRTGAMMSQGDIASMMTNLGNLDMNDLNDIDQVSGDENEEADYQKRASSHIITVDFGKFEDGTRHQVPFATVGQINNLIHSYAATCHKCQGSEYDTVIVMVHSSNHLLMFREWLYTAITRAAKRVVLLYDDKGLSMAINRQRIKGSNLEEKAVSFLKLMNAADEAGNVKANVVIPTLPEPKEI